MPFETRQWLIERGTSPEYGARELKRTIHKHLTQPLATLVAKNQVEPGTRIRVLVGPEKDVYKRQFLYHLRAAKRNEEVE